MSSSSTDAQTLLDVVMPQMGVSVSEGTIVEWRKQVGDWVEYEEALVDISTDKIDTEVPSPAAGSVAEIVVEVGTTVEVGAVLARLTTDAKPGQPHASEGNGAPPTSEAAAATGETQVEATDDAPKRRAPGARRYSPVVQRIAAEHDVDQGRVSTRGAHGRPPSRVRRSAAAPARAGARTGSARRASPRGARARRGPRSPSRR